MRKETMDFAKNDLTKTIRLTNDEDYINKVWNLTNDHFEGRPEDDPRNHNLGFDFWDNRKSEINMYNVKSRLIENIEAMPEDYPNDLTCLYMLYTMSNEYLKSTAAIRD